jgi:DnaJ domain
VATTGDRSHYDVLGISVSASTAEVRDAYRRAARDHHPDAGGDGRRMSDLNAAWHVLGDPARRAAYDRQRTAGRRGGDAGPGAVTPGAGAGFDAYDGGWDAEGGVYRSAEEWADIADAQPLRPVRSLEGWWAILPPATLVGAISMFFAAFLFMAPALVGLSLGLFVLALGLFVLAPLRAMARRDDD